LRARSTRAPFARVVPPAALARRRRIVRYIFHRVRARARVVASIVPQKRVLKRRMPSRPARRRARETIASSIDS